MGHLGFSYVGLLFLLLLTVPNLFWTRHRPKDYSSEKENKALLAFEKTGQVCVTCSALIFSDFNLRPWSPWSLWLAASVLLMALYEFWWIRYFRGLGTLKDFYGDYFGIPVPGAVLPVAAFFLLGVYGRVFWLMLSVTVLGIGHIGIHLQHRREILEGDNHGGLS